MKIARLFLVHTMIISSLYSVQESALFKKDLRLINVPVAGIYSRPNAHSSYDSQKIYGHAVEVIEKIDDTWVKVKTEDGITNYSQQNDLIVDNVLWRTSEQLQRVRSLAGCVYPTPSVKNQSLILS